MGDAGALFNGFGVALQWENLLLVLLGVLVGNLVGVLPGLGPAGGTVLLIPFTFALEPASAIILLGGVYYGAMYGGSTTSILLNIPGETSSVMTAVEGHPLAKQGRGGQALGMSAISSFIAGTVALVGITLLAPTLAQVALSFGPPEIFTLILAAFTIISSLASASLAKGLLMGALGVLLATIGVEPMVVQTRLTFGIEPLLTGVSFVAAAMGLFAIPEVLVALENPAKDVFVKTSVRIRNLIPSRQDFKDSSQGIGVATGVGFIGGLLPGGDPTGSSFFAYGIGKRVSKHPERFGGNGSMEAVAIVEGTNNAAATSSLVPLLSFGIPGSATAAVLLGAFLIHGLQPGPLLFQNSPEVAFGLIASMYLGNVMLLILNMPLIGMWITLMRLPTKYILSAVFAIAVIGAFADSQSFGDVWIMFAFGVLGYVFRKLDYPPAPLILGLVLTGTFEQAMHQSMIMSRGDWSIFVTRPLSVLLLAIAVVSVLTQIPPVTRRITRAGRWVIGRSAS